MARSDDIFNEFGGVPIALASGDWRVKINGRPPVTACRILPEEVYQALVTAADERPAQ